MAAARARTSAAPKNIPSLRVASTRLPGLGASTRVRWAWMSKRARASLRRGSPRTGAACVGQGLGVVAGVEVGAEGAFSYTEAGGPADSGTDRIAAALVGGGRSEGFGAGRVGCALAAFHVEGDDNTMGGQIQGVHNAGAGGLEVLPYDGEVDRYVAAVPVDQLACRVRLSAIARMR